jgi:hypothetical protein
LLNSSSKKRFSKKEIVMTRLLNPFLQITIPCLILVSCAGKTANLAQGPVPTPGLQSGSNDDLKTEAPAKVAEAPTTDRQNVIAAKERELSDLENRMNGMRDNTHATKFRGASNRDENNTERDRVALSRSYSDLGKARSELNALRNAESDADFAAKQASFDRTVASIRADLDRDVAE